MHAEALLDGDQVAVVIAEERAEQIGLLELELETGAAGIVGYGWVAARHQAATFVRRAPVMLRGPSADSFTGRMSPGTAFVSTWTD